MSGLLKNGWRAVPIPGLAVPDQASAMQIAKAVYLSKFGEAMDAEHPLAAEFKDGIWIVSVQLPEGVAGRGPRVEVRQKDGCVLKMDHTQ